MQTYFDWPYAVLYLILIYLTFQYKKNHRKNLVTTSIVVVFIFVAFRAPVVGADTWDYVRYLTGERNYYNNDIRDLETLFVIYREIINFITDSRFVVMIINTVIAMFPIFYMMKKYSANTPLSLLLFFYLGCLNTYFVGLRQILGFSFVLWALLFYLADMEKERSKVNFKMRCKKVMILLLGILVGYLFHTSNIIYGTIFILLLFVPIKSKVLLSSLIIVSCIFGVLLEKFDVLSFLKVLSTLELSATERLSGYLESEKLETFEAFTVLLRPSMIGLVALYFMSKEKVNHIFTKVFVFGIVIYNLLFSLPMISRFLPSFFIFGCVIFTWIFNKENSRIKSKAANVVFLLILLYFTRSAVIGLYNWNPQSEGRMHPYYFFFQDYNDHPSLKYF